MAATLLDLSRRKHRSARLLLGSTIAVNLLAVIFAAIALTDSRGRYEAAAGASTRAISSVLVASMLSEAGRIDFVLNDAIYALEHARSSGQTPGNTALERYFERQRSQLPAGSTIRATDASGRVVLGTGVSSATHASWAERPFFTALKRNGRSALWVTHAMVGVMSGAPIIAFVRRYDAQGHFSGVVSVAVPVGMFSRLLQKAGLGPKDIALLRDVNLGTIARFPPLSRNGGAPASTPRFLAQLQRVATSARGTVTFFTPGGDGGIARIVTARRISGWPFMLVVGRARSDYLAPWRQQVRWAAVLLAMFTLVTSFGAWRLWRELQRSARAGRQAEDLLKHASDGLHVLDGSGHVLFVSDEFCAMLGFERDELIGKHVSSWDALHTRADLNQRLAQQMESPARQQFETIHRRKDGSTFPVQVSGKALDILGERLLFNSSRDITEQRKAQEQIAQGLEDLRESQEIAEIGSYVLHVEAGFWTSSEVLDRLFGIDAHYERTLAGWAALVSPEDREDMLSYFRGSVLGERQDFDREYRITRPLDGQQRWVHGRGRLLSDAAGQIVKMRGTIQDITRQVQYRLNLQESEERFRALVEQSVVSIYIIQDGIFRYVNPGFAKMHGFASPAEVIDRVHPQELVAECDRERVLQRIAQRTQGELQTVHYTFTGLRKDGSTIGVEVLGRAFTYKGQPAALGIGLDITERLKAEEDLRIAATAFESQEGIMVTDADGIIKRVNRAFTRITGYAQDDVIGKTTAVLHSGRQDANFYDEMWAIIRHEGYWQGELVNQRKDGGLYTQRLAISAVTEREGRVSHYVGSVTDITEQRDAESRAQHLAYFDALTDLPNRVLLHDRLEKALARSRRNRECGAVLFVDLDNFKKVNDTVGHRYGDQLLVQAAQRLRAGVRDGDTVARFGGDEFVVLLEGLGSLQAEAGVHAGRIADKLRTGMSAAFDVGSKAFYCTASIGATVFDGESESPEAILMHADLAMYRAKQDGRNALRFFEEGMQIDLSKRTALELELRDAVQLGQFVLHYQAQVDRERRIVGAEALVRWNHPHRGVVLPGEFIGLAEETGLIVPLGRWVLGAACAQLRAWSAQRSTAKLALAVNVSARQFAQADFVDDVIDLLNAHDVAPYRLKLELTESTVLDSVVDVFEKMRVLKQFGVMFSLDDFGTGSSSLSYLTRLPLGQLKIDKSFVDELPSDPQDAMVAQTIIAMGKGLGLDVLAEGVESAAQLAFLMEQGCDAFQGYLFAPPMALEKFAMLLESGVAH